MWRKHGVISAAASLLAGRGAGLGRTCSVRGKALCSPQASRPGGVPGPGEVCAEGGGRVQY